MKIADIKARQILDSRGVPTIECSLFLEDSKIIRSSVPSGASVGKYEAVELRDGDPKLYLGKSVFKAISNIENKIAPEIVGKNLDLVELDKVIIDLDGTKNKSNLGANAILAVSMAMARAQALVENIELYQLISKIYKGEGLKLPKAMFNVLNGGVHADNGIDFQEFMIMPIGNESFAHNLEMVCVVYSNLKKLLIESAYNVGVGDEGGFAPIFAKTKSRIETKVLDFLCKAVEYSGFELGKDIVFCLDVAASQFYNEEENVYVLGDNKLSSDQMVSLYEDLISSYPIYSIEDGLDEQDWVGWQALTESLGNKVQLVGDDIFVTNIERIRKGVELGVANATLIKPNQIGTVSETLWAMQFCKNFKYKTVVSHRSGETNDSFISDLVVGTGSGQFKAGAPARGERVSKYNRLLKIEEDLLKGI